jgi:hypothetical protein
MKITLKEHPRAKRSIRRTRGAGGLAGFVISAYLSHKAGLTAADLLARALLMGLAGHVAGWALAVTYWRGAALAEVRQAALKVAGPRPNTPAVRGSDMESSRP